MDELTLLRGTRDEVAPPTAASLNVGRAALLARAAENIPAESPVVAPAPRPRRVPRLRWAFAGVAGAAALTLAAGNLTVAAHAAEAAEVLRGAAVETLAFADPAPGSGEYLRSRTHARWGVGQVDDDGDLSYTPNDQILDVYKPADPEAEWVLYRDWGELTSPLSGQHEETIRAREGEFYGPGSSWELVDYTEIPRDGQAAYEYIDAQYNGGSASRDEDNFVRITDILRTGLVPAEPRAALLEALAHIPGVSATDGVPNLDGAVGVAIGRTEALRFGERQEIIIDPATGLVIGERTLSTRAVFGWGVNEVVTSTAIETTVSETAP